MTQAQAVEQGYWIELIPSPKWVRVVFAGEIVADCRRELLVRERGRTPVYYFPLEDVREGSRAPTDRTTPSPHTGEAAHWNVVAGNAVAEDGAWSYPSPLSEAAGLQGHAAFEWGKMDTWLEDGEEVHVHPRDPYKWVDSIHSSRHVRVLVGGETVADTHSPVLLFEAGLPTRYYIPRADVRMDLLRPSDTVTRCPYKGEAHYLTVAAGERPATDIIWYYPYPTAESAKITGMLCFYQERVDALYVDDVELPKLRGR